MPGKKAQALLALLAMPAGQAHRRDKLATMLWSRLPEESARQNLRQCLTAIRRGCKFNGAVPVVAEDGLLRLDTERVVVDASEFEEAVRCRDPAMLGRACALYKGELLEGLDLEEGPFEEWLSGERRRLKALAIAGLSELLRHQGQAAGGRDRAIQTALRLLTIDPLQEEVHRSLMHLYHKNGSTAQALRQYEVCEKTLRRELGIEPEDVTKKLRRDILQSRRVPSASTAERDTDPGSDDRPPFPTEATAPAVSQDRPSVAVLPFANLSGNIEQDYFSDGITADIITELSRFSELLVIARSSSFAYKGKAVDVRQVGRELNVRYLLEGSIRRCGERVRITAQLVDVLTGGHRWADRYDRELKDIFAAQEEVASAIVSVLADHVYVAEIERARRKPTENLGAYDLYLRGMAEVYKWTREGNEAALRLFYRSIERDPEFPPPYGAAAMRLSTRKGFGWIVDRDQEVAEVRRLARRVMQLGKSDEVAFSNIGHSLAYVAKDLLDGVALIDRALALNPNLGPSWTHSGWSRLWLGDMDLAIEHFAHALRRSPVDRARYWPEEGTANAHFFAGRHDEALAWARMALRSLPDSHGALRIGAASSALAGRDEEAKKLTARLREIDPALRVSTLLSDVLGPYQRSEDVAKYGDALRKAGLPE
jgi:TolB-like protein/DNA-binding SARP family transcriptional activator